jgi:hypothetical protein
MVVLLIEPASAARMIVASEPLSGLTGSDSTLLAAADGSGLW